MATPRPIRPSGLLVLSFGLPTNPSRFRVSVWRRLRRAGARAIHKALFALPDTPLNRLRALDLAHDVESWGGTAWLFVGEPLARRRVTRAAVRRRGVRRRTRPSTSLARRGGG